MSISPTPSTSAIPLIVVLGPTASGKSSLAIHLAQSCNGEIISADALAVYKQMHIGTAAPTLEEQQGIQHHCLNCIDPNAGCNGQQWFDMAEQAIADITKRGKQVIIAGGTPLYTKMLLEGISAGAPKDPAIRAELEQRYDDIGGITMLAELAAIDPDYASERHANDKKRVVRALEVHSITGKPYSHFHTTDGIRRDCFRTLLIGLRWDKEVLHKRINARAKKMFADGLIAEVQSLRAQLSKQALDGVGYKEVVKLLDGEYDQEECLYRIKVATRRLAKHQLTWYRRWQDIQWLAGDAEDLQQQALTRCRSFLETK